MLILMVGCKSEPSSSSATTTTGESFTVVSHLASEPSMLNPYLSTSSYNRQVFQNIFSNLVHYDTRTLELAPMLVKEIPKAQSITEGEHAGKVSLTYEIHDNAVWSNGTPVTGHDVDFTLKAILNPKVPAPAYRAVAASFFDINIDEANPKKFTLIGNNYFLLDYVFTDLPILPEYVYDQKGIMKNFAVSQLWNIEEATKLADSDARLEEFANEFKLEKYQREKEFITGCGAYELEEWLTGQRVILKKKKDWWGKDMATKYPLLQANPESIIFRPIKDQTTAITELKSGGLDAMTVIQSQQLMELKESTLGQERLNFYSPLTYGIYYMGINSNRPKLADKRVRKAIAHLIDADKIISDVIYGYGSRIVGPIHPNRKYFNSDLKPVELNVEKAIQLLKEAGWEDTNSNGTVDKMIDGERTELVLDYRASSGGIGEKIGLIFLPNAKRAGVGINIITENYNNLRKELERRDYDLFVAGWNQDPSLNDLYQTWHTDNDTPKGGNKFGFGTEESDDLIEKIRTQMSTEERTKLYHRVQEIIYDEQPCVFLYAAKGRMAINKKFEYTPSTRKPGVFENEFKLRE